MWCCMPKQEVPSPTRPGKSIAGAYYIPPNALKSHAAPLVLKSCRYTRWQHVGSWCTASRRLHRTQYTGSICWNCRGGHCLLNPSTFSLLIQQ